MISFQIDRCTDAKLLHSALRFHLPEYPRTLTHTRRYPARFPHSHEQCSALSQPTTSISASTGEREGGLIALTVEP